MILTTLRTIISMLEKLDSRLERIEKNAVSLSPEVYQSLANLMHQRKPGRPPKNPQKRGPQNTRMMKVERAAVVAYLEVEQHRFPDSCTPQDAMIVWNRPENKAIFDAAAKRNDQYRGYGDFTSLSIAVVYYAKQAFLKSHRRNHIT